MKLERITLLRPNMGDYRSTDGLPPLSMAILAARTPADIEVTFYDDKVEVIPEDDQPDLVALTVETFTAHVRPPSVCLRVSCVPPSGGNAFAEILARAEVPAGNGVLAVNGIASVDLVDAMSRSGFLAFFATLYISEWFWVLPHYLLFSVACLHLGAVVYRRRRRPRQADA